MELTPLKSAAMTAWSRVYSAGLPGLYVVATDGGEQYPRDGFKKWRGLEDATAMLAIPDVMLVAKIDDFLLKLSEMDDAWFQARIVLMTHRETVVPSVVAEFLPSYSHGGVTGKQLVSAAHEAYVELLRRIDALMS